MIYNFFLKIVKLIISFFYPQEICGIDGVNKIKKKIILCSNHVSNLDAIFLYVNLERKIYFLAKSELFKNKLLGNLLKKFGAIPIQRGKKDTVAISMAEKVVYEDKILGIFIEGTRCKTGNFLRPKSGTVVISLRTNCPILPVCITPFDGKKVKMFKKTRITFGTPINLSDLQLKDDSYAEIRRATDFVMQKIKMLREANSPSIT